MLSRGLEEDEVWWGCVSYTQLGPLEGSPYPGKAHVPLQPGNTCPAMNCPKPGGKVSVEMIRVTSAGKSRRLEMGIPVSGGPDMCFGAEVRDMLTAQLPV